MEKEYNDNTDYDAILGDFSTFLDRKDWASADVVIDNVVDLKNIPLAFQMCKERCAAIMKDRMTLPADYGEEKSPMDTVVSQFNTINKALYGVEPFKKSEEEIPY